MCQNITSEKRYTVKKHKRLYNKHEDTLKIIRLVMLSRIFSFPQSSQRSLYFTSSTTDLHVWLFGGNPLCFTFFDEFSCIFTFLRYRYIFCILTIIAVFSV